jgi:hypothetical protein
VNGQRLSDETADIFRLAADPGRLLSCVTNDAGEKKWRDLFVVHAGEGDGPYAAMETFVDGYEFSFLPGADDVKSLLHHLLALNDSPPEPDAPLVTLNLTAYAALLAAADALQATRLRTRLARTEPAKPVLTPNRGTSPPLPIWRGLPAGWERA